MFQGELFFKSTVLSFLFAALVFFALPTEAVAGQLSLSWIDNSTSEDGFNIERRLGSGTAFTQIATVGANVTSYIDNGLLNATTYCYRVQAFNAAGVSAYSNERCLTTTAATTSYTLTVMKNGTGAGTVTATGINCGSTCSASFASGTSVALTATAASGSSFAGWSGTGCGTGTLTVNGNMACTATFNSNVTIDPSVPSQLTLTWTDNSTNEDGFRLERRLGSGTAFTQIATVGANVTMYTDTGLLNAMTYCYRVQAYNAAGSSPYSNEQCLTTTAATTSYTLTVMKNGTGAGTVTATVINCGGTCSASFASGTLVTLTATAASGSSFTGWSGTGCGTGTVTVNGNMACTATFKLATATAYTLSVSVAVQATSSGSASGKVVSSPTGINCGTACNKSYSTGTVVALTAIAGTGSVFTGWSGDADCADDSVTLNANKSCTANFSLGTTILTIAKVGSGTVVSTTTGINCGSTCSASFATGSTIALKATPAVGYQFVGWSGAGCQGAAGCSVALSSNQTVTASFVSINDKIGIYRPSSGQWFLDLNGNGTWDDCGVDFCVNSFTSPSGVPVVGGWSVSGVTELGLYLADTARWQLDGNGNENWDGCDVDICLGPFGERGDIPVSGKWSLKGDNRIGIFRPSTGKWYMDFNDRCPNLKVYEPGDLPVTGDWNGNGLTQVGFFRPSTGEWFLDFNGNRMWDGCKRDSCVTAFGTAADLPVTGDWDGTGTSKIGVFRPGTGEWFLDLNGNGKWDGCGIDLCFSQFGQAGDIPVIGKW